MSMFRNITRKTQLVKSVLLLLAGMALLPACARGATYYVAATGSDTGGGSELDPWLTISNALYQAGDGDMVVVSAGAYTLTKQLELTNSIHLRGAGGDPAGAVVNANQTGRCLLITHTNALVSAMTFSNGLIGADLGGGGIRMTGGTVSNCVITHNTSTNISIAGAGVHMSGGMLLECTLTDNAMRDTASVPKGGAIYMNGGGLARGCVFLRNRYANRYATGSAGSGRGAGVYINNSGRVEDCEFRANICSHGTIVITGYGTVMDSRFYNNTNSRAVIHTDTDSALVPLISNCYIVSNDSNYAAAFWLYRETVIEDCDILHNNATGPGVATLPAVAGIFCSTIAAGKTNVVRRCRIMHNQATHASLFAAHYGAAVWVNSNTVLENCLIAGNNKGGVYVTTNALNTALSSCTIASNGNYGVFFDGRDGFRAAATNCIVYFNDTDITNRLESATNDYWYCCAGDALPAAQGNLAGDPDFLDIGADDYRLGPGSPCADRGINLPWMAQAADLGGNKRIMMRRVDIGAFERFPPSITVFSLR